MKLEIAKSEMRCSNCFGSIERGEYFATPGPRCFTCARQQPAHAPQSAAESTAPSLFRDPERELVEEVKSELGASRLVFAGATYNAARDKVRLTGQTLRIFQFMRGGGWYTLREIEAGTSDPQASISARLRAFKLPEMGGHRVEKRLRSGCAGTWEYQLHPNVSSLSDKDKKAA